MQILSSAVLISLFCFASKLNWALGDDTELCKHITFKTEKDQCDGPKKHPIIGNCTHYFKCDGIPIGIYLKEASTICPTGQYFHWNSTECVPGTEQEISDCLQVKCLIATLGEEKLEERSQSTSRSVNQQYPQSGPYTGQPNTGPGQQYPPPPFPPPQYPGQQYPGQQYPGTDNNHQGGGQQYPGNDYPGSGGQHSPGNPGQTYPGSGTDHEGGKQGEPHRPDPPSPGGKKDANKVDSGDGKGKGKADPRKGGSNGLTYSPLLLLTFLTIPFIKL